MAKYKYSICMAGMPMLRVDLITGADMGETTISEKDCNSDCKCLFVTQAVLCMEGHLTECHAGKSCKEANCSHYQQQKLLEQSEQADNN